MPAFEGLLTVESVDAVAALFDLAVRIECETAPEPKPGAVGIRPNSTGAYA